MELLPAFLNLSNPWFWLSTLLLFVVAETLFGNFFFLGAAMASLVVAGFVWQLGPEISTRDIWIIIGFASLTWLACTLLLQRMFGGNNRIDAKSDPNEF